MIHKYREIAKTNTKSNPVRNREMNNLFEALIINNEVNMPAKIWVSGF